MSVLATAWFQPAPPFRSTWFGPDGRIEPLLERRTGAVPIAEIIGPPGPAGDLSTDLVAHYILAKS